MNRYCIGLMLLCIITNDFQKKYLAFPERLNVQDSSHLCSSFNGVLAISLSEVDYKEVSILDFLVDRNNSIHNNNSSSPPIGLLYNYSRGHINSHLWFSQLFWAFKSH